MGVGLRSFRVLNVSSMGDCSPTADPEANATDPKASNRTLNDQLSQTSLPRAPLSLRSDCEIHRVLLFGHVSPLASALSCGDGCTVFRRQDHDGDLLLLPTPHR